MSTATHVIICGQVFPWNEKAPYVMSGNSVLGALEYNQEQEVVKCHECGDWFKELGVHAYRAHGVKAMTYKSERGISYGSSLSAIASRKKKAKNLRRRGLVGKHPFKKGHQPHGNTHYSPEVRNLHMACKAQLMHKARELALRLRRTPTAEEFRLAGMHHGLIKKQFGLSLRDYVLSLGMEPRPIGKKVNGRSMSV
jgi:hypothetical protein